MEAVGTFFVDPGVIIFPLNSIDGAIQCFNLVRVGEEDAVRVTQLIAIEFTEITQVQFALPRVDDGHGRRQAQEAF